MFNINGINGMNGTPLNRMNQNGLNSMRQMSQPKMFKITKPKAEQYISAYIGVQPNQIKFEKLDEMPNLWKHACLHTGVTVLNPTRIYLCGVEITFTLCSICGTVHYYFDKDAVGCELPFNHIVNPALY